ncbi:MAG: phosphonopyruvate decarboxylase [Methanobacteriota archaeon]|nr:MAG: phosphonopyruvate decarboxylase [Euryarchaeota archaeon]
MIDPATFLDSIRKQGVNYYVGVPDSLLKDLCAYLGENVDQERHVISANEGNAVGLAAGWYLGSGQPAMVYMQNSGIGNSFNPLVSLADPEVYSIPMVLVVGWRGAPGTKDEPQHMKQGRIMTSLLDALEIPYFIMDGMTDVDAKISDACASMYRRMAPVVILIMPGAFAHQTSLRKKGEEYQVSREDAMKAVVSCLSPQDVVVSTTGKLSRELYEHRRREGASECRDFLTVGSMGHASSIAMALSSALADRKVICLDGDASVIMHMGSMATIGQKAPGNLVHIVLNNGSHESVGGQPTVGFSIDFVGIAKSCGYRDAVSVHDIDGIIGAMARFLDAIGPSFLEIRVSMKARSDLGRPVETPVENRKAFMRACGSDTRR